MRQVGKDEGENPDTAPTYEGSMFLAGYVVVTTAGAAVVAALVVAL
jgi:hypothetical protein